jgi:hypothetical protein
MKIVSLSPATGHSNSPNSEVDFDIADLCLVNNNDVSTMNILQDR